MTRQRVTLVLILLLAGLMYMLDVSMSPEGALPLPAASYSLPILAAAYLLPPTMVAITAIWGLVLYLASAWLHQPPIFVETFHFLSLVALGYFATAYAMKTEQDKALAVRSEKLAAERQHVIGTLSTLIETMPVGVVVADAAGTITMTNPAATAIFGGRIAGTAYQPAGGYTLHYPDGRPLPPDDLPMSRAIDRGEAIHDVQMLIRRRDGQERVASASASPVLDEQGRISGAVAVMQDITERRRAEVEREHLLARLSDANQRLQVASQTRLQLAKQAQRHAAELDATISSIPAGTVIYGPDREITHMNETARRVLGVPPEEWALPIEQQLKRMTVEGPNGKPLSPEETPTARSFRGETVHNVVLAIRRHDINQTFWISASSAPICAPDGTSLGAILTFADITPFHELQQQQEDLLHTVSHDLRAPLTVIQAQAQLLGRMIESARQDGRQRHSVESIVNGAKRMNSMIQDLVDSARLESGQLVLHRTPLELPAFLLSLREQLTGAVATQRIRIDLPPNLPRVLADADRLQRVLTNLFSNALKYSPPETDVLVTAERVDAGVKISISDKGVGIPPSDLPHIFDRFYRTRAPRRAEGVGLGLYISRKLVEAMGGHIRVDSEVEKGSTFRLTLPSA